MLCFPGFEPVNMRSRRKLVSTWSLLCGTVGSELASGSHGPWFESRKTQHFFLTDTVLLTKIILWIKKDYLFFLLLGNTSLNNSVHNVSRKRYRNWSGSDFFIFLQICTFILKILKYSITRLNRMSRGQRFTSI